MSGILASSESVMAPRQWAIVIPLLLASFITEAVCVMSASKAGSIFAYMTWRSRRNRAVREGMILLAAMFLVGLLEMLVGNVNKKIV